MATEEELTRFSKLRDFQRFIDAMSRKEKSPEGYGFAWFTPSAEPQPIEKVTKTDEVLKLSSEVQELKNQINKYLKVEAREESLNYFKEMIVPIKEIKDVYAEHKLDKIVFYILYDKGSKTEVIEKVVDIEIELRKVFNNMKFDFHFLSSSDIPAFPCAEAVYSRRD